MVLAPGVMAQIHITSAKLPAPVLKRLMVSQAAMQTRLAPQNLIFGHRECILRLGSVLLVQRKLAVFDHMALDILYALLHPCQIP